MRPRAVRETSLGDIATLAGVAMDSPDEITRALCVTGISLSAARIEPGDLYAALPGTRIHGARFAHDAVTAGARAIMTDVEGADLVPKTVPTVCVPNVRAVLGAVSAEIYGHPDADLRMIGVTGTQGKTTTTRLLEAALVAAGEQAAVIGTVGTRIKGKALATALTTPEAPDLQGLLATMREDHVAVCAMEVSSHALVLGRVDGVTFDVAAFTNLGRDHLDFHADFEEYFEAKAQLFTPERSRRGIVSIDDEYGRDLVERGLIPMSTMSIADRDADWRAVEIDEGPLGSRFRVRGPQGLDLWTQVNIPGIYNVANALCALALGVESGGDAAVIATELAQTPGVPGRLERISGGGPDAPTVYVDYAHKPDAIIAALTALRPTAAGQVVMVIGAGGDRDSGKRPLMGAAAGRLADRVIVTDDNPRSEDPSLIRKAVLEGARTASSAQVVQIGDRHQAIAEAIASCGRGDVVVIAGKGHETGQEIAGTVHPFDDAQEAQQALEAHSGSRRRAEKED